MAYVESLLRLTPLLLRLQKSFFVSEGFTFVRTLTLHLKH